LLARRLKRVGRPSGTGGETALLRRNYNCALGLKILSKFAHYGNNVADGLADAQDEENVQRGLLGFQLAGPFSEPIAARDDFLCPLVRAPTVGQQFFGGADVLL